METKEQRIERRANYLKLAVNGLTLGMTYIAFKPILDGEPVLRGGRIGNATMDLFPQLDSIPWLPVAVGLSLVPFFFEMTKRIPRRVVHASKRGQLVDTDWQDVAQKDNILQYARESATSRDRRRHR